MVRNSFAPIAGERHRFSAEARLALSHVIMLEQATWIAFQKIKQNNNLDDSFCCRSRAAALVSLARSADQSGFDVF
jgi:hypothetical protein